MNDGAQYSCSTPKYCAEELNTQAVFETPSQFLSDLQVGKRRFRSQYEFICFKDMPHKLLTPLTAYKAFITMQNDAKKGWKGGVDTRDGPPAPRGGEGSPFAPHCGDGCSLPSPSPLK